MTLLCSYEGFDVGIVGWWLLQVVPTVYTDIYGRKIASNQVCEAKCSVLIHHGHLHLIRVQCLHMFDEAWDNFTQESTQQYSFIPKNHFLGACAVFSNWSLHRRWTWGGSIFTRRLLFLWPVSYQGLLYSTFSFLYELMHYWIPLLVIWKNKCFVADLASSSLVCGVLLSHIL